MPRIDTAAAARGGAARACASSSASSTTREIPALFRRADLVLLPYREIDQSGVLFTALAFGAPLVLSAVGGFPEVAESGAAELVPPGDAAALHATLARLLGDAGARERLAAASAAAARERYAWEPIARRAPAASTSACSRRAA